MLIGGCIPEIKRTLNVPVLVTLQGDDIFLEHLPDRYRAQALAEIHRLVSSVDGFMTNSRYYGDFMQEYLRIPHVRLHQVPLGIDTRDFQDFLPGNDEPGGPDGAPARPPAIGYLARLAPEKGLHILVDAFIQLRKLPGAEHAVLRVAGWLSGDHRDYVQSQLDRIEREGLSESVFFNGSVDRDGKLELLRSIDVLSVPTTYRDPKGLFVLEAMAAGVPCVQPDHGAFPELVSATQGGLLVPPGDAQALARALHQLVTEPEYRRQLGAAGQHAVHQRLNADAMARNTLDVFRQYVPTVGRQTEGTG
jgi:glycosyltransferase involved in cell wall biosynthesis